MVTSWFPEQNALPPLVFIRLVSLSVWRFYSAADLDSGNVELALGVHCHGGIGIIWSLIWFKVYQPPRLLKASAKLNWITFVMAAVWWR